VFKLYLYAAFDFVTHGTPLTEDKIASRKPYEDLGMSVGRRGWQLAFRMIAADGVGDTPS
jgi:hypothetical protein